VLNSIFAALQITMIDIVLSGDNMGVIALAVRKLPQKQAKMANLIGVSGAIFLRILFASVITSIMLIEWLPIKLIGGILLLKITWNLINLSKDEQHVKVRERSGLWKAVYNIIMADMSVSLDNVLAVGSVARGNIVLVIFGLLLNIPIIFFGSQLVVKLIQKHKITIFIGAGILIHTSLEMILEDRLVVPYVSHVFSAVFPWTIAVVVIIYGFFEIRRGGNLF
jgi:YjbE family integral membrane protein